MTMTTTVPASVPMAPAADPRRAAAVRCRVLAILLVVCGLMAAGALIFLLAGNDLVAKQQAQEQVGVELTVVRRLQFALREAEAGQHDFLITGDPGYLEQLGRAQTVAAGAYAELRALLADSPPLLTRLEAVEGAQAEFFFQLQRAITLQGQGDGPGARAVVLSNADSRAMGRIQGSLEEVVEALRLRRTALNQEVAGNIRLAGAAFLGLAILVSAVLAVAYNVTVRALRERSAQQRRVEELSRRVVAVQEEERGRLAAMIHGTVKPNLASIDLNLITLSAELVDKPPEALESRLADLRALTEDTMAAVSDLSADLRPVVLDYAGLMPALEGYCRQFAARTGIQVAVSADENVGRPPGEVESVLFRIVQETLANCAKHARATRLEVALRRGTRGAVLLKVSDNGVGFTPGATMPGDGSRGFGILSMRERVELAGGVFGIESRPGGGTTVTVEI